VLVVENEPLRALASLILRGRDYELLEAADRFEALRAEEFAGEIHLTQFMEILRLLLHLFPGCIMNFLYSFGYISCP
jgi:hypothetical protein